MTLVQRKLYTPWFNENDDGKLVVKKKGEKCGKCGYTRPASDFVRATDGKQMKTCNSCREKNRRYQRKLHKMDN